LFKFSSVTFQNSRPACVVLPTLHNHVHVPWIERSIESIYPYARNARQIPQAAVDKVAASIQEFGWRQPIVVD
jgi:hypothetical protein